MQCRVGIESVLPSYSLEMQHVVPDSSNPPPGWRGGLGSLLAGCATFSGEGEPSRIQLTEVSVDNLDTASHTVQVMIQNAGEPVYWESMAAEPFDTGANQLGGGVFAGIPTDPGQYEVYARYAGQPPGEWRHFEYTDITETYAGSSDVPCVGIHIRVGSRHDRTDPPQLTILTSVTC